MLSDERVTSQLREVESQGPGWCAAGGPQPAIKLTNKQMVNIFTNAFISFSFNIVRNGFGYNRPAFSTCQNIYPVTSFQFLIYSILRLIRLDRTVDPAGNRIHSVNYNQVSTFFVIQVDHLGIEFQPNLVIHLDLADTRSP